MHYMWIPQRADLEELQLWSGNSWPQGGGWKDLDGSWQHSDSLGLSLHRSHYSSKTPCNLSFQSSVVPVVYQWGHDFNIPFPVSSLLPSLALLYFYNYSANMIQRFYGLHWGYNKPFSLYWHLKTLLAPSSVCVTWGFKFLVFFWSFLLCVHLLLPVLSSCLQLPAPGSIMIYWIEVSWTKLKHSF